MKDLIIVRGGGDIATGTIYKLKKCGFSVLILEIAHPSAIRRNVAFSEAVYEDHSKVEDMECFLAKDEDEAERFLKDDKLTMLIDPKGNCLKRFKPMAVVDAILAKKNLGTTRDMAPITIALGPGFTAGQDCDAVVETMRGHKLGRVIYEGKAIANTGVPGIIGGYAAERVIHAPVDGILHNIAKITDIVEEGQPIAWIEGADGMRAEVPASLSGLLRGLIREGYPVTKGFKMADIDPRLNEYENCFTISDKARCIAGGVVEAYFVLKQQLEKGDAQCMSLQLWAPAARQAGSKILQENMCSREKAFWSQRRLIWGWNRTWFYSKIWKISDSSWKNSMFVSVEVR